MNEPSPQGFAFTINDDTGSNNSSSDSSTCTYNSSSGGVGGGNDDSCCISRCEDNDAGSIRDDASQREDEDKYASRVRLWTQRIPIGLGLCPWAVKSQIRGRLKFTTCKGEAPLDVGMKIISEIEALCRCECSNGDGADFLPPPPLTSTLVVCPKIEAWNKDFQEFDNFVKNFGVWSKENLLKEQDPDSGHHHLDVQQKVTLVSFHPEFLRWRGLPKGVEVGSTVKSHKGMCGFKKSQHAFSATVVETSNSIFGLRKIKVRFHDDQKEQYVPTDWIGCSIEGNGSSDHNCDVRFRDPLPDNAMHRSPYPTIHLIRNEDLGTLCMRDVSRVKRKNAQRMAKLGWQGIQQKAGD